MARREGVSVNATVQLFKDLFKERRITSYQQQLHATPKCAFTQGVVQIEGVGHGHVHSRVVQIQRQCFETGKGHVVLLNYTAWVVDTVLVRQRKSVQGTIDQIDVGGDGLENQKSSDVSVFNG